MKKLFLLGVFVLSFTYAALAEESCQNVAQEIAALVSRAHLPSAERLFIQVQENKLLERKFGTDVYGIELYHGPQKAFSYEVELNRRTCQVARVELK